MKVLECSREPPGGLSFLFYCSPRADSFSSWSLWLSRPAAPLFLEEGRLTEIDTKTGRAVLAFQADRQRVIESFRQANIRYFQRRCLQEILKRRLKVGVVAVRVGFQSPFRRSRCWSEKGDKGVPKRLFSKESGRYPG
jgi:hypothetical protein